MIHTDLSIHKSCCDLLRVTMEATKEMRRDFKSSIGTEVRALCVSMLLSVMRANKTVNPAQKITHIDQVLEDVEVFNDLFRVCRHPSSPVVRFGRFARRFGALYELAQPANAIRVHLGPLRGSKPNGALFKALFR